MLVTCFRRLETVLSPLEPSLEGRLLSARVLVIVYAVPALVVELEGGLHLGEDSPTADEPLPESERAKVAPSGFFGVKLTV